MQAPINIIVTLCCSLQVLVLLQVVLPVEALGAPRLSTQEGKCKGWVLHGDSIRRSSRCLPQLRHTQHQ